MTDTFDYDKHYSVNIANFVLTDKYTFYNTIGRLDVHPHPEGTYPYRVYFTNRNGDVRGIITEDGEYLAHREYFKK